MKSILFILLLLTGTAFGQVDFSTTPNEEIIARTKDNKQLKIITKDASSTNSGYVNNKRQVFSGKKLFSNRIVGISASMGGSSTVVTDYLIADSNESGASGEGGGLVVIRGNDSGGNALIRLYLITVRVAGGVAGDVASTLVSSLGSSLTFTFSNSGGYVAVTPSGICYCTVSIM